MKTAVIIPWRQGETELQTTIDSAAASIGKSATIYPIEDTTHDGPAKTRHRGVMAATTSDVIIMVDAHMIFDKRALLRMARYVNEHGGLICPKCYHNPECTFDAKHPSGASFYSGADIYYKTSDGNGQQALCWKWSTDPKPGPRPCVGGACYVFRREWYFGVGQPLSALPGWGGDEEALSISAWLSGHMPQVFDGRVAHRWRERAPWKLTGSENKAIRYGSRAAIIGACVADQVDRADLLGWLQSKPVMSKEIARWREALLKQPRTWAQWKAEVAVMPEAGQKAGKRKNTPNLTTPLHGVVCPHCHSSHDPKCLKVNHTWPNGNRRHKCPKCNRPFISVYRDK